GRNRPPRRFLYYGLGGEASNLQLGGRREHELQELAVEVRRARLQRRQHGTAIDLHEQVVGQVGEKVEPQQAVERRIRGKRLQQGSRPPERARVRPQRTEPREVTLEHRELRGSDELLK